MDNKRLSMMAHLELVFLLYAAFAFLSTNCDPEDASDEEKTHLPKFLSEADLSSVEGSAESVEALKKIVKRLAPEKNGEYQLYQGVTGQPGVDFPALTSIPATTFSCRGLKGGYFADLETNCQVFHICDNGRKISFLCPNGTIFQQSQLICDWWFKVDCSKSVELYEQSSEQLADEERKRAEARKLKLELQRTNEKGNSHDYYDVQSLNYDGTQNGRISPYDEPQKQPQVQINRERVKPSQYFDSNNLFGQDPVSLRDSSRVFTKANYQANSKTNQPSQSTSSNPQYNQYNDYDDGNANKYSTTSQDYYATSKKAQNYHGSSRNSNSPRDEKVLLKRLKYKNAPRNNATSPTTPVPKMTPMYMESTTFRASSISPIKESQQFAESAAFVSNRGNRYNENTGHPHQFYYQLYANRDSAADEPDRGSPDSRSREEERGEGSATTRNDYESYTDSPHTTDYERKSETTMIPQETTLQYAATTVKPPCDSDRSRMETVTSAPPTTHDFQQLTESPYPFYNTNNDYQESFENTAEPRNTYPDTTYYRSAESTNENAVTGMDETQPTNGPGTTRSYITTESYRHQTATTQNARENTRQQYTANAVTSPPTTYYDSTVTRNQENTVTQTAPSTRYNTDTRTTSRNPQVASQAYRQESTSASTEKPFRSTHSYQQNASTEKDISPYDTSFTYKQGKVMSTLGPYIPFTRNYAFTTSSTTTTSRPTTYSPMVPTSITTPSPTTIPTTMPTTIPVSTSTAPPYYSSPSVQPHSPGKSLIPKLKHGSVPTSSRLKSNSQYLPKEKEHALNMLHSLQSIEDKVLGLTDTPKVTNRGRSDSPASGPSTLHSLALYFSTATENFDSRETTDSAVERKHRPEKKSWSPPRRNSTTVEVPTSLLTQHTISSYAELFKLNNALETNNGTTEDRFDSTYGEEYADDLDIQQSGGLVSDNKNGTGSNGTKLRELAQVFTHALSAYLQDPGTFKKVLTEIRPTEPAETTTDSEQWRSTTPYPTFEDEYTSGVREKDEVLDFSDDDNELARQKLTTAYPATVQQTTIPPDFSYNDFTTRPTEYYTTPGTQPSYAYDSSSRFTTASPAINTYYETSTPLTGNTYSFDDAQSYDSGSSNDVNDRKNDVSEGNYFSSEEVSSRNRVGGFQNNSAISSPYGKVKLYPGHSTGHTYIASSTPPTRSHFGHSAAYSWNRGPTSRRPEQQLTPPFHDTYGRGNNRVTPDAFPPEPFSTPMPSQKIRSTTVFPPRNFEGQSHDQSYKIHFYNPPNPARGAGESLATARTSYIKFRNYNRVDVNADSTERPITTTTVIPTRPTDPVTMAATETDTTPYVSTTFDDSSETNSEKNPITVKYSKSLTNDHWTSSPAVTRLWETSVFVDPKRINHGLEDSDSTTTFPTTTVEPMVVTERLERSSTPSRREEISSTPSSPIVPITNEPDVSPPWQWLSKDKDSPTAFTLLPTAFSIDKTATPKPVITTRSSITTTITSSVTSTNAIPQENFVSSLLPYALSANKVNETEVAEKLFGKLNSTSTNTLIRVMKQADNNETVRQLVLLLISHCKEPANHTTEREKEQLINTLLRMPVNEFTSDEARNVVAGINKLNAPTIRSRFVPSTNSTARTRSASTSPTLTEPPVTTLRNRKSRRFRTTTEDSANLVRRSDNLVTAESKNSLTTDETSASDGRALELLRSLYTIATKWG